MYGKALDIAQSQREKTTAILIDQLNSAPLPQFMDKLISSLANTEIEISIGAATMLRNTYPGLVAADQERIISMIFNYLENIDETDQTVINEFLSFLKHINSDSILRRILLLLEIYSAVEYELIFFSICQVIVDLLKKNPSIKSPQSDLIKQTVLKFMGNAEPPKNPRDIPNPAMSYSICYRIWSQCNQITTLES